MTGLAVPVMMIVAMIVLVVMIVIGWS